MVTFFSNNFENKTPRLFKQLWTSLDFEDVTLAIVDDKQITNQKVCSIGIRQDGEEISCNICDPVVYKTEFELKEHEHAIYEGLISEYNDSDCEDTPVDLDGILESTDLTYVEWSFNRVFWDNHRVVSDLEADRQRRKDLEVVEDIMKTKEITKVADNIDAKNEGVLEKAKVTEIKFASTDIRYRKQKGSVDSGKVKKPPSIKYIDEEKEETVVSEKNKKPPSIKYIHADKERTDEMEKVQVTEIKFASTDIRYRKQKGSVDSGKVKKPPSIKYIDEEKEETVVSEKVKEIKFASTDIRYRKQQGPVESGSDKKPPSKYKRSHNQYKTKKQNVK